MLNLDYSKIISHYKDKITTLTTKRSDLKLFKYFFFSIKTVQIPGVQVRKSFFCNQVSE